MSEGNGRLELLPPAPAQLSQMIRRPAEAAGIRFEVHATTSVALNDVIAAEVAHEPSALPLLSYLMDQLYRADVLEGGGPHAQLCDLRAPRQTGGRNRHQGRSRPAQPARRRIVTHWAPKVLFLLVQERARSARRCGARRGAPRATRGFCAWYAATSAGRRRCSTAMRGTRWSVMPRQVRRRRSAWPMRHSSPAGHARANSCAGNAAVLDIRRRIEERLWALARPRIRRPWAPRAGAAVRS